MPSDAAQGTVEIWGSGRPRREFLHVDDLADAAVFLMRTWSDDEHVNIGTGEDVTSAELAELIARIIGFDGSAPEPSAYTSIHPCKTIGSGLEVQHRPVLLRFSEKYCQYYRPLAVLRTLSENRVILSSGTVAKRAYSLNVLYSGSLIRSTGMSTLPLRSLTSQSSRDLV